MAPSIRVSQEVYNGLRKMIESSYAPTISSVIEKILKEEGVLPQEENTANTITLEKEDKNEENENRQSLFNKEEEKEIISILGDAVRNYRYQREAMREVYNKYNGNRDKVVRAYAWLDENKYAPRRNNTHNFNSIYYAEALFNDGVNKGWLK
jgi:hypothetical protein